MSRVVVSVSVPPGLAAVLRKEADERGQSFSARVSELLELGRAAEGLALRIQRPEGVQT